MLTAPPVPNPAASVTAGILVIGGGIVLGALLARELMRRAATISVPSAIPQCGEGTVWSDRAQRCIPRLKPGEPVEPPPSPPAEDDWGTGMQASTQALLEGIAVRLLRDSRGHWNFAYSWRADRGATGDVATYLADDPDEDTILVMSHSDGAGQAYQEAISWVEKRLVPFVREKGIPYQIPASTVASSPIMWESDRADHWVLVAPSIREVEGIEGLRYWDYEEPEYFGVTRYDDQYVSGCCYDHNDAWREALRYY